MGRAVNIKNVRITGGFWKEKQELIKNVTVPYIWKALNNEIPGIPKSSAVENFQIASGEKNIPFHGLVSQDSDLFKWMEAAAYALLFEDTGEIEEMLDKAIQAAEAAQMKDGYLNSYYIIEGLKNKWSYLKESCQLYCAGHLLEAAAAHYEVTGETRLLDIACRYADCIDRSFGPEEGKIHGYDGHAEIELALFKLYKVSGCVRYQKLAEYFINERGKRPYFFLEESRNEEVRKNLVYALEEDDFHHSQSHMPIREQKEAVGHAVKAMYFYSGAADLAGYREDEELLHTLQQLWTDVTHRKMYLTGAIGACEEGESFSYAYDLPPDLMYGETCASIGLFLWAHRMLLLEQKGEYGDVMERALYNGVLSGISEEGTRFFYTNPLEMDPKRCENRKEYRHLMPERQPWFACPCCPPNIARLFLSLQQYLYNFQGEVLCINHFAASELNQEGWHCSQDTDYPFQGEVRLQIQSEKNSTVKIRIPGWCREYLLEIDGQQQVLEEVLGYVEIPVKARDTMHIRLVFIMEPVRIYANDKVEALTGKTAYMKGPLVYCGEEKDNGNLSLIRLKKGGRAADRCGILIAEGYMEKNSMEDLYGEQGPQYEPVDVVLIPYYLWNNRGIGKMKVWITNA